MEKKCLQVLESRLEHISDAPRWVESDRHGRSFMIFNLSIVANDRHLNCRFTAARVARSSKGNISSRSIMISFGMRCPLNAPVWDVLLLHGVAVSTNRPAKELVGSRLRSLGILDETIMVLSYVSWPMFKRSDRGLKESSCEYDR